MSRTSSGLAEEYSDHVQAVAIAREPDVLRRLREETGALPDGRMQISPEQGRLMELVVRSLGVRRAIEVGTFTGYSAICVASALPADGRLVACDVSEEWTSIARRYWAEAGVADRIDLRLGPASETLAGLIAAGEEGTYEFAFIDADKTGYDGYYEQCLELLSPGGWITFDNMFLHGDALDPDPGDASAVAIDRLTRKLTDDARVEVSLVPIGDGLLIARKR